MEKSRIRMKGFALIFVLVFSFIASAGVQSAHAIATLRLSDGTTTFDVTDGGANDSNLVAGAVTYSGYGVFGFTSVLISTGVTYPLAGTIDYPVLHMSTIEVSGMGTLDVYFSETGFGPTGLRPFKSDIGGLAGGSVSGSTYVDGSNVLFGTSTPLATFGPSGAGPLSGTGTNSVNPADPYSLTTKTTITHTASQVSSVNLQVAVVPEPISTVLFITGGATLGFRHFRRKKTVA